jgi:hypothetical protein
MARMKARGANHSPLDQHQGHEGHKGQNRKDFFFVLLVFFVSM